MLIQNIDNLDIFDNSLDVFEEQDWKFLNVETTDINYEYFNDLRDIDLEQKEIVKSRVTFIVGLISIIVALVIVISVGFVVLHKSDTNYNAVNEIASVNSTTTTGVIVTDGNDVTNQYKDIVSPLIEDYFKVLGTSDSFKELNMFCEGESTVYNTYKSYVEDMKVNYDKSDCTARGIKSFLRTFSYLEIQSIYEKDGKLYCSLSLYTPSSLTVGDYINVNSSNINKYFSVNPISTENVCKWLVENMEYVPISRTNNIYVVEITEDGHIVDDSILVDSCTSLYNEAVMDITYTIQGVSK